jgi:hypothetical protein
MVTVRIFDADLLVPSTLHDACNAHGIVTVTLVDLQLQSRLRSFNGRWLSQAVFVGTALRRAVGNLAVTI